MTRKYLLTKLEYGRKSPQTLFEIFTDITDIAWAVMKTTKKQKDIERYNIKERFIMEEKIPL